MNTEAFKDCDIRGTYPEQVNEDIFARVGREFGRLLAETAADGQPGPAIVISGDGRNSTRTLMRGDDPGACPTSPIDIVDLGYPLPDPGGLLGQGSSRRPGLGHRHRLAQPGELGRAEGDERRDAAAARRHPPAGGQGVGERRGARRPGPDASAGWRTSPRTTWRAMIARFGEPAARRAEDRGRPRQRLHVRHRQPGVARSRGRGRRALRRDRPGLQPAQPRLRRGREPLRSRADRASTRAPTSASASTATATGSPWSTTRAAFSDPNGSR